MFNTFSETGTLTQDATENTSKRGVAPLILQPGDRAGHFQNSLNLHMQTRRQGIRGEEEISAA